MSEDAPQQTPLAQEEAGQEVQEFTLRPEGVAAIVNDMAGRLAAANRGDIPTTDLSLTGPEKDEELARRAESMRDQVRGAALALDYVAQRPDGNSWSVVIGDKAAEHTPGPSATAAQ